MAWSARNAARLAGAIRSAKCLPRQIRVTRQEVPRRHDALAFGLQFEHVYRPAVAANDGQRSEIRRQAEARYASGWRDFGQPRAVQRHALAAEERVGARPGPQAAD